LVSFIVATGLTVARAKHWLTGAFTFLPTVLLLLIVLGDPHRLLARLNNYGLQDLVQLRSLNALPRTPLSPEESLRLDYRKGLRRTLWICGIVYLLPATWVAIRAVVFLPVKGHLIWFFAPMLAIIPIMMPLGYFVGGNLQTGRKVYSPREVWSILPIQWRTIKRTLIDHLVWSSSVCLLLMLISHSIVFVTANHPGILGVLVMQAGFSSLIGIFSGGVAEDLEGPTPMSFIHWLLIPIVLIVVFSVIASFIYITDSYGFTLLVCAPYYLLCVGIFVGGIISAWRHRPALELRTEMRSPSRLSLIHISEPTRPY